MTGLAFLLLALTLVIAAGNWLAVERENKALEYICKPLTMIGLISVALAMDAPDDGVLRWFLVALVLCLIGDVFLMLPQDLFVFGLGAFLLGHIAYIVGMQVDGTDWVLMGIGLLAVLAAMGLIGMHIIEAVKEGDDAAMAGPVIAYMVVISAMVITAAGTGKVVAIAGASLFYASDALIAWNRFIRETPHHRLAIMVTYHLGQIGLVLSLL